ncbi:Endonuclease/Exonuclease/phosphatase family protein [Gimesia panareensis]|uniref:Endonuclease/Exonuclease/phosphatase family protein n=2 Tax=Gimesia panareensis TaxID=2527978 RepID=A0A518FKF7_9PLAN|nr:Endonuclease/Exonuclease/phosphatase family protein [Gimesia panareensis]QDV16826.1 Endonuclease/Exonuclease/phosphatase family protein [Gimesia panareensis]
MNSEQAAGLTGTDPDSGDHSRFKLPHRKWSWIIKPLATLLSIGWVLSVLVRLTVRDSGGTVSTLIFYMSPLILLSVGAAFLFGLTIWIRWYRVALIWLILSLLTGIWCYQKQFQTYATTTQALDNNLVPIRVLFWNVGDRLWSIKNMVQEVKRIDADVVAFVEAESYTQGSQDFWKKTFPEYDCQVEQGGFVLLSRLRCLSSDSGSLGRMGRYLKISLVPEGSPSFASDVPKMMTAWLVDINSDVFRSRKQALQLLADQVQENGEKPALVLGDFNTPGDSVHFEPLRKQCRNTFEAAGDGYNATWPLPLPVLDLDGIWVNSFWQVRSCENRWTWYSDHRPVVAELLLQSGQSQGSSSR